MYQLKSVAVTLIKIVELEMPKFLQQKTRHRKALQQKRAERTIYLNSYF